jgi:hypothetical protein
MSSYFQIDIPKYSTKAILSFIGMWLYNWFMVKLDVMRIEQIYDSGLFAFSNVWALSGNWMDIWKHCLTKRALPNALPVDRIVIDAFYWILFDRCFLCNANEAILFLVLGNSWMRPV